jgi:hypothetical protein
MSTEVKHGVHPVFQSNVEPGEYSVTIVGHYTDRPGLAAAGVTEVKWQSDQPAKRRAELLALRTAFRDWYESTMTNEFGTDVGPDSPYRL